MKWQRTTDFNYEDIKTEKWLFKDHDVLKEFKVKVKFGKPMDVFSLKESSVDEFSYNIKKIKTSREELYKRTLKIVNNCPVCNNSIEKCEVILNIYGAEYVRCSECNHVFIKKRPIKEEIEKFYRNNSDYQATYANKANIIKRVNQIAIPKAKFIIEFFKEKFGKMPKKILDVGAGSGHFVYACRNLGIEADGIEISTHGRDFAKENFDINLFDGDFVKNYDQFKGYDVITFWGVIEHVTNPVEMLIAARKVLGNNEGIVVSEVPRWNSISTCVQIQTPDRVIRHLDPLGHINCFTDMSIATAFIKSSLDIVGAWYFGMDAFELLNQLNYNINKNECMTHNREFVPYLQEQFDLSRLSDEIVLIGTNNKML